MSAITVALSVGARPFVAAPVALMLGLMACTYTLYYQHGGTGLPTISNTFTDPPGNYLSRGGVGVSAAMLYVVMGLIYLVSTPAPGLWAAHRRAPGGRAGGPFPLSNKTILIVGLVSVFSLSCVGAICDSSKPSCGGNNAVHTTFAIIFFLGIDLIAIYITCVSPRRPTAACHALLLLSIASKARFLYLGAAGPELDALGLGRGQSTGSVFEITDVVCIMGWMLYFLWPLPQTKSMALGVVADSAAATAAGASAGVDTSRTVLARCSTSTWAAGAALVTAVPVALCAALAILGGHVPKGTVPAVGDCFTFIPANWVSRWGLVFGGVLVGMLMPQLQALARAMGANAGAGMASAAAGRVATIAGGVCALAMMVAGAISKVENAGVHGAAGTTIAVAANAHVLALLLLSAGSKRGAGRALPLLVLACTALKLRFLLPEIGGTALHVPAALRVLLDERAPAALRDCVTAAVDALGSAAARPSMQWIDAAASLLAAYAFVVRHVSAAPGLGAAIWSTADAGAYCDACLDDDDGDAEDERDMYGNRLSGEQHLYEMVAAPVVHVGGVALVSAH